jgi:hypothetical protein
VDPQAPDWGPLQPFSALSSGEQGAVRALQEVLRLPALSQTPARAREVFVFAGKAGQEVAADTDMVKYMSDQLKKTAGVVVSQAPVWSEGDLGIRGDEWVALAAAAQKRGGVLGHSNFVDLSPVDHLLEGAETVHNHPNNSAPSSADFRSFVRSGMRSMIVIGRSHWYKFERLSDAMRPLSTSMEMEDAKEIGRALDDKVRDIVYDTDQVQWFRGLLERAGVVKSGTADTLYRAWQRDPSPSGPVRFVREMWDNWEATTRRAWQEGLSHYRYRMGNQTLRAGGTLVKASWGVLGAA